jgi:hypothetical protein
LELAQAHLAIVHERQTTIRKCSGVRVWGLAGVDASLALNPALAATLAINRFFAGEEDAGVELLRFLPTAANVPRRGRRTQKQRTER